MKSSGRVVILKGDRSLFGRIIVMAQGHNLKTEAIPSSWALSTPDGLFRKTNKADISSKQCSTS